MCFLAPNLVVDSSVLNASGEMVPRGEKFAGGKWIMHSWFLSAVMALRSLVGSRGFMTKLEVIETPAGHMFCPRHEVTGVRIPMRLNDVDFAKVDRGPWRAEVTDQKTGKRYKVKGASCGFPRCMCDAVITHEFKAS